MSLTLLQMLGGLAILVVGAEILVRGSVGTALRFGLTPLLIGLTIVAFGTSAPELVVSIQAAYNGSDDIALGNIIGSNISNIALILGIAALIQPLKVQTSIIRKDVPILLGVSMLLVLFLLDGVISQLEGFIFFVGVIVFTVASIRMAKMETATEVKSEFEDVVPKKLYPLWLNVVMIAAGLGLLVLGAKWLVDGAIQIATSIGMSQAVVGLTIVAVGTSLPELATSVMAAFKKEGDIAIGNVVGSNIFNILCILGITAMILPVSQGGITMVDILLMLGLTLFLLPVLRSGYIVSRIEGGVLLATYVVYTAYLVLATS
jgi:cation:H+ antiporter